MPVVHGRVNYLHNYYPYDRGNNPLHDATSRQILNLKNRGTAAILDFAGQLDRVVPAGVTVCVVPSSSVGHGGGAGIGQIAAQLCATRARVNGVGLLYRHTQIAKLAHGGRRDIDVHLDSIVVQRPDFVRGRSIYLLDDVVTSGNSFFACERLLRNAGAVDVTLWAVGATTR